MLPRELEGGELIAWHALEGRAVVLVAFLVRGRPPLGWVVCSLLLEGGRWRPEGRAYLGSASAAWAEFAARTGLAQSSALAVGRGRWQTESDQFPS